MIVIVKKKQRERNSISTKYNECRSKTYKKHGVRTNMMRKLCRLVPVKIGLERACSGCDTILLWVDLKSVLYLP